MSIEKFDVVVVGSGNAGFSAAVSAKESGASKVLLVEKAPVEWAGGNTTFTAGAYRTVFRGLEDVLPLVHNVTSEEAQRIDMDAYTEKNFMDDLRRVTNNRAHPEMAQALVRESNETTKWLAKNGIKFQLSFNRQAYKIRERWKFWGGMVLAVVDGGKGLTQQHQANAARIGVEVRYDSPVTKISMDGDTAIGVIVQGKDGPYMIQASAVILCAGGFEANPSMRAQYLGPGWDLAYVRGTPHNTGSVLKLAMDIGAQTAGNWSGCHSTCWDANAPWEAGDQILTNQFTKSGYPLGVMLNAEGRRFVDEGLDMRNYTYAKFGREILKQPGSVAFQVWDADGVSWLREEEYASDVVERISAGSLEELADKLASKGMQNSQAFKQTLDEYNTAVARHREENAGLVFDPSKKDGLSTRSDKGGLVLDKTNWAIPIVKSPFLAVKVTCGITFTFGGLKIDPVSAAVMSEQTGQSIPGLYCAGEMASGLFYENYPGGSGLTSGAVFGRKAGRAAASRASGTNKTN